MDPSTLSRGPPKTGARACTQAKPRLQTLSGRRGAPGAPQLRNGTRGSSAAREASRLPRTLCHQGAPRPGVCSPADGPGCLATMAPLGVFRFTAGGNRSSHCGLSSPPRLVTRGATLSRAAGAPPLPIAPVTATPRSATVVLPGFPSCGPA